MLETLQEERKISFLIVYGKFAYNENVNISTRNSEGTVNEHNLVTQHCPFYQTKDKFVIFKDKEKLINLKT